MNVTHSSSSSRDNISDLEYLTASQPFILKYVSMILINSSSLLRGNIDNQNLLSELVHHTLIIRMIVIKRNRLKESENISLLVTKYQAVNSSCYNVEY